MEEITKSKDITTKDLTLDKIKKMLFLLESGVPAQTIEKLDVIKMQNLMEELIHGEAKRVVDGEDAYDKSRELLYAKNCLDSEFSELTTYLPFKEWKLKQYMKVNNEEFEKSLEKSGGQISMEVVDMAFFYSVMMIKCFQYLGLPASDKTLKMLYALKYIENIQRVNSGTFDKARELTKDEEAMIAELKVTVDWFKSN